VTGTTTLTKTRAGLSLVWTVVIILGALHADRMHRSIKDLEARVARLEAIKVTFGDPEIPACSFTVSDPEVWENLNAMGAWKWPETCVEAWKENRRLDRALWDAEPG
jgi:hypothetical protein